MGHDVKIIYENIYYETKKVKLCYAGTLSAFAIVYLYKYVLLAEYLLSTNNLSCIILKTVSAMKYEEGIVLYASGTKLFE